MATPDLTLDDYWVTKLAIEGRAPQDAVSDQTQASGRMPSIGWTLFWSEENDAYLVEMKVRFGNPRVGTSGSIELAGVFSSAVSREDHELHVLLEYNAPAMLFGVARGLIGATSATLLTGKYVLPTANFIDLVEKRHRSERRSARKSS